MKSSALRVIVGISFGARLAGAEAPAVPLEPAPFVLPSPAGDAQVSLGVLAERADTRSELAGFLSVEVPLERFAAPRALRVASADRTSSDAPSAADGGEPDDPRDTRGDSASGRDPDGVVAPALPRALLSRLARDTLAAALRAHGAGAHERALDSVAARARSSAVLPELRLRASRTRDESLRLAPTTEDPSRYTLAGGDGMLLEAQATFRLSRLLFADEELPVERLRLERERGRERLGARVTAGVVAWHRAVSRELGAPDPAARARAELARLEAELELDLLTDGWFGARVERLGLRPAGVEWRDPSPPRPAAPKPASKRTPAPASARVRGDLPPPPRSGLDAGALSAKDGSLCLPTLATDSRTFCGVLMR